MVSEEELKNMSPEEIRKLQEQNCFFCKIAKKEVPAKVIYEDDIVISFLDIKPVSMGHALVMPKKHNVFFSQLSDEETKHIFKVTREISRAMLKELQARGTNMFMGNGEVAGQVAPHFMLHIIPRWEGKDIPTLHPMKQSYKKEELVKVQHALISRLEETMEIDLKSKILHKGKKEESKQEKQEEKEEQDQDQKEEPEEDKKEEEKGEDHEGTKSDAPDKEEKKDDVDLDKISELFK